ncbi:N-terminal nucleophile aminohydrolase [Gonapodya prolifera JEL478]|uniref:Proteasome subunit beta n=1 Tax=Gonapodya prolifera (strain JEL478) TaxID=1344416 RepID=A0A139AWW6_GONPJ|nr:N-terminal nucleophile aminohydrolase [Gonapodya prolifera JEL478]|eukprot:KXS21241.1 N-terminal nucleophile aminohydrolase [Gonapodya prolifera JEL478]
MDYNGAAIVAMKGKNCVAIASDRRFGVQAQTVSTNFKKIFEVHPQLYYGLGGLATDVLTLSEIFEYKLSMYKLREGRDISPKTFANLAASTLYERRFGPWFVEPVIAGLEKDGTPFVCGMDLIGALNFATDFIVSGTAKEQLYGMAESLWEPDLGPEDLFEIISQTLLNAQDRDALSGWGGVVTVITPEGATTRYLKSRMD